MVRYISRLRRYIGVDNVRPSSDILERVADGERSRYAVSSRVGTVSIISSWNTCIFDDRSFVIELPGQFDDEVEL